MSSDEEFSVRSLRKESQYDDTFSIMSSSPPRPQGNKSRRTTNTGPKGVRADARAYEASKREAAAIKNLKNTSFLTAPVQSQGESGSEASEDEWMSRWREQRMKELSKTGVAGVNLFGQVDDVDARGYLAAVDFDDMETPDDTAAASRIRARRNVVTVVLVYDNVSCPLYMRADLQSTDSKTLFQLFSKLARRHPTTHFLRLPSQYAEDMARSALPAVLAYRRGTLIANLVHFVDEIPPGQSITLTTVEGVLSK